MATSVSAPRVILGAADVRRYDGELRLTIPILNGGDVHLPDLLINAVTLASSRLTNPPGWPLYLGLLGASNSNSVAARFSDQGLVVGANLLLTVRGSYAAPGGRQGLTLNRYIKVPPPGSRPVSELQAAIHSTNANGLWNYTLENKEPIGSTQRIATFALDLRAPVTVTGVPPGWAVDTDSISYVLWYSADPLPPYPSHVAPGASLAGFQLAAAGGGSEVVAANVVSWDHAGDTSGKVFTAQVLTPRRLA